MLPCISQLKKKHGRTGQCFERVTGALRVSKKSFYKFLEEYGLLHILEWGTATLEGGLVKIFKNT